MAGQKVQLKDQLGRVIRLNADATNGAQLGVNLFGADGRLLRASDILNPTGPTPNASATVWKLVREVPSNLQKIAKLDGKGLAVRGGDGEWFLRSIEGGEGIDVADGDGEAGNPTVSLQDVEDSGAGTLQAVTVDAKGRVVGTRAATITGTAGQIDVAHGEASDGVPTISLADLPDGGAGAALVKITRDGKGRVSDTASATTSDLPEGSRLYFTDARADARIAAQKGQPNGLTPLGPDSLIPSQYLPPLAITEVFVVASEAAQLALDAQEGDVAIRTDLDRNYIHNGGTSGTMADWTQLLTPAAPVQSVNGKTGNVVLDSADVGAATAAQGLLAQSAVQEVVAGSGVAVDSTDPQRPVVSATGGGGFAPYFIPDGQTFVVPANQQALFTLPIELGAGSSIVLDGALVEVS